MEILERNLFYWCWRGIPLLSHHCSPRMWSQVKLHSFAGVLGSPSKHSSASTKCTSVHRGMWMLYTHLHGDLPFGIRRHPMLCPPSVLQDSFEGTMRNQEHPEAGKCCFPEIPGVKAIKSRGWTMQLHTSSLPEKHSTNVTRQALMKARCCLAHCPVSKCTSHHAAPCLCRDALSHISCHLPPSLFN